MLDSLVEHTQRGGKAVDDAAMMINFGPHWRRTAFALEGRGYLVNTRSGWRVTEEGKVAPDTDPLSVKRKVRR